MEEKYQIIKIYDSSFLENIHLEHTRTMLYSRYELYSWRSNQCIKTISVVNIYGPQGGRKNIWSLMKVLCVYNDHNPKKLVWD